LLAIADEPTARARSAMEASGIIGTAKKGPRAPRCRSATRPDSVPGAA
jgi:hypothetical protein